MRWRPTFRKRHTWSTSSGSPRMHEVQFGILAIWSQFGTAILEVKCVEWMRLIPAGPATWETSSPCPWRCHC